MRLSHLTFVREDNSQLLVGSPQRGVFIFSPENTVCDIYTASLRLADELTQAQPQLLGVKLYLATLYRQLLQHLEPSNFGPFKLTTKGDPNS